MLSPVLLEILRQYGRHNNPSNGSFPEKTWTTRIGKEAARESGFFADGQNPVPCSSIVSRSPRLETHV
jgi:hypothetical protein